MCLGIPGQIVEISDVARKLALVQALGAAVYATRAQLQ